MAIRILAALASLVLVASAAQLTPAKRNQVFNTFKDQCVALVPSNTGYAFEEPTTDDKFDGLWFRKNCFRGTKRCNVGAAKNCGELRKCNRPGTLCREVFECTSDSMECFAVVPCEETFELRIPVQVVGQCPSIDAQAVIETISKNCGGVKQCNLGLKSDVTSSNQEIEVFASNRKAARKSRQCLKKLEKSVLLLQGSKTCGLGWPKDIGDLKLTALPERTTTVCSQVEKSNQGFFLGGANVKGGVRLAPCREACDDCNGLSILQACDGEEDCQELFSCVDESGGERCFTMNTSPCACSAVDGLELTQKSVVPQCATDMFEGPAQPSGAGFYIEEASDAGSSPGLFKFAECDRQHEGCSSSYSFVPCQGGEEGCGIVYDCEDPLGLNRCLQARQCLDN